MNAEMKRNATTSPEMISGAISIVLKWLFPEV